MKNEINLKTITEILTAIEHYNSLGGYFNQLDPSQYDSLNEYVKQMLTFSQKGSYMDDRYFSHWKDINLHIIDQTWSNTSCGWEGIGGCAISNNYSIIIENLHGKAIFVYYNGKLAYVAKDNEKLKIYKENNYQHLPGLNSAKNKLDLIYKK